MFTKGTIASQSSKCIRDDGGICWRMWTGFIYLCISTCRLLKCCCVRLDVLFHVKVYRETLPRSFRCLVTGPAWSVWICCPAHNEWMTHAASGKKGNTPDTRPYCSLVGDSSARLGLSAIVTDAWTPIGTLRLVLRPSSVIQLKRLRFESTLSITPMSMTNTVVALWHGPCPSMAWCYCWGEQAFASQGKSWNGKYLNGHAMSC